MLYLAIVFFSYLQLLINILINLKLYLPWPNMHLNQPRNPLVRNELCLRSLLVFFLGLFLHFSRHVCNQVSINLLNKSLIIKRRFIAGYLSSHVSACNDININNARVINIIYDNLYRSWFVDDFVLQCCVCCQVFNYLLDDDLIFLFTISDQVCPTTCLLHMI